MESRLSQVSHKTIMGNKHILSWLRPPEQPARDSPERRFDLERPALRVRRGEKQPAARFQHAGHLVKQTRFVKNVFNNLHQQDEIE
jgi:hypothetical protein